MVMSGFLFLVLSHVLAEFCHVAGHDINLKGAGHMRCDLTGFSGALLFEKLLTCADKALDIICTTKRLVRRA